MQYKFNLEFPNDETLPEVCLHSPNYEEIFLIGSNYRM